MDPTQAGQSRSLLQLRVGTFILVALLVLVGLIYFLGRQAGLFERQYRLVAGFPQVGGLADGATVRLAGVPVGRVTAIRLPPSGAAGVQVELTLVRRVQSRVRADSVARIETLGLLGDKIVEVTLGSPEAPVLPEGAELRTEEPLDTTRLVKQGTELLRNLVEISTDLKTGLAKVSESAAGPDLAETVRTVRALATEIERGRGLLHRLIYDPQLGAAVADAAGTLRQVAEAAQRVDRLFADPTMAGLLDDARHAVAGARGAMERVDRVVRQVEQGPGFLHALVYDARLGAAAADAADALRQLTETTKRLDALLGDPKMAALVDQAGQTLTEARQAMERVNRVVRQVEEGRGVLHALIYGESQLVQDLDRLLSRADALVASVERGEGALGVLVRDQDAARAIRRVAGAAEALAQAVDRVREADGLLQALVFDPGGKALVADLRETARHFREVTARVARGEGLLGSLTQPGSEGVARQAAEGLAGLGRVASDPRLGEALTDLRAAMANLRAITARVEAGEGTIGGLMADPTVYENLAAFLEGAQRSLLLRALIRLAIGHAETRSER
ncbi:MAG: MCE family protein [Candidatus Rokubacteria bacterium]|nr:MCE family protein [Candidatus Rokubacteria bacterium]